MLVRAHNFPWGNSALVHWVDLASKLSGQGVGWCGANDLTVLPGFPSVQWECDCFYFITLLQGLEGSTRACIPDVMDHQEMWASLLAWHQESVRCFPGDLRELHCCHSPFLLPCFPPGKRYISSQGQPWWDKVLSCSVHLLWHLGKAFLLSLLEFLLFFWAVITLSLIFIIGKWHYSSLLF